MACIDIIIILIIVAFEEVCMFVAFDQPLTIILHVYSLEIADKGMHQRAQDNEFVSK